MALVADIDAADLADRQLVEFRVRMRISVPSAGLPRCGAARKSAGRGRDHAASVAL
ncbi:hypothetical protein BZL30_9383 [Mycobacterium kansasii]|uniref:Uncharacterized protein n=1 Tax=Mycobacterium kansasii TaxID=1768 RepID=A0A1V3W9X8_MYCKA|nr:hypothetical protein BZL30_9383 [Mycobacterium kansasii]